MNVSQWIDHRAYFKISDCTVPRYRLTPPPSKGFVPETSSSYTLIHHLLFSDEEHPPPPLPHPQGGWLLEDSDVTNIESLAQAYSVSITEIIERWRTGKTGNLNTGAIELLNRLLRNGLLDASNKHKSHSPLAALFEQFRVVESDFPKPRRAPALVDGTVRMSLSLSAAILPEP
ncbi:MAG: hypothetical protein M2R45_02062 [Verrucomicrobia subdivision 3 bacterium]|nr:hypothetical protein [Limisphaerales bacterium]MCS1414881.1 hypothetical protein [Limisphaerales bacterium]